MASLRTVKVFVSSPGDVDAERKRVELAAERLNGIFAGIVNFKTERWENRYYKAHETFQKQIPEAETCDIVIGILWSRLGSELPPGFPMMPSEKPQPFPSGTAYELLTSIWKRQKTEANKSNSDPAGELRPDVYIFQKETPPFPPPRDEKDLINIVPQWEKLKDFIATWLRKPNGHYLAAFQSFKTTDEFEARIELLLRDWLTENVLGHTTIAWPAQMGSPFRGLEAFDARHAPVFFGRARDITRATDRLKAAVRLDADTSAKQRGSAFLLLAGASGAGKSSLARAGIAPRLTTPGVVKEIDIWRLAIMRPSDSDTPLTSLAEALFAKPTSDGRNTTVGALPELEDGDYKTPAEFAELMKQGANTAIKPIMSALDRIAEAERSSGAYARSVRVDLLLIVDQLDDLFASDISPEQRSQYSSILDALVRTGRVWVLATLRAALYERFLEDQNLKALKDTGAVYDLVPPTAVDLADIVRKPAEAAGLAFERNEQGKSLDDQLLEDAAGSDTLPLLQFTLQRLYEMRETVKDEKTNSEKTQLTFKAYGEIGGLAGAVNRAAEDALKDLKPAELDALPRLLRQLVVPTRDPTVANVMQSTVTVRAVPEAKAAPDDATRNLVKALDKWRILTFDKEGHVPTVRVAHQRVIESWKKAADIVRNNAEFLRIRSEVENQRLRWEERGRRSELLLSRGLPLAEAETIVTNNRDELDQPLIDYVAASGRHARLRQRLVASAAAVFGLVAVVAVYSWRQAQNNLDAGAAAISALVEATSAVVAPVARLDTIEDLSNRARETMNRFSAMSEDPRVTQQRARTLIILAELDQLRDNIPRMKEQAEAAIKILDRLASSGDPEVRHQRARTERLLGLAYWENQDKQSARAHYQKGISELNALLQLPVDHDVSWPWTRSLSDLYQELGDVLLYRFNDKPQALAAFQKCYELRKSLIESGHTDQSFVHDLAWAENKLGDVALRMGNEADTLMWYDAARMRLVNLGDGIWNNLLWPEHLAVAINNFGLSLRRANRFSEADDAFVQAEKTMLRLTERDPNNRTRINFLAWTTFNRAETLLRWAMQEKSRTRLAQSRDVFKDTEKHLGKIASQENNRSEWQFALIRVRAFLIAVDAMIAEWDGNPALAAAAYEEAANELITNFMPQIDQYPNPNFVSVNIEFVEWAGLAWTKAGRSEQGQKEFQKAIELTERYRAILGDKIFDATLIRLKTHLNKGPPTGTIQPN